MAAAKETAPVEVVTDIDETDAPALLVGRGCNADQAAAVVLLIGRNESNDRVQVAALREAGEAIIERAQVFLDRWQRIEDAVLGTVEADELAIERRHPEGRRCDCPDRAHRKGKSRARASPEVVVEGVVRGLAQRRQIAERIAADEAMQHA